MGSLRTLNRGRKPIVKNSNVNVDDSSPSYSGDKNVDVTDEQFDDTVPCCEDTFLNHEEFDTQLIDVEDETQLEEETQLMELAGETQVMDDYDIVEDMDTQLLDISDGEDDCGINNDREGAKGTGILDRSIDVKLQDGSGNETVPQEKGTSHDGGATRSDSLPSDNVAQSSGCLRRGFASVRTASLRTAGLAARQTASINADHGSCSTDLSSVSCELHPFDDFGGISHAENVGVENDMEIHNYKGLNDGDKNNISRSLARKLFTEEDVAEVRCDDNISDRRELLSQLPCDNDVAGLSYVDSQEPGELSQANALEFVNKFLKISVFESEQGVMCKKDMGKSLNTGVIAKGVQSIAQQANLRSTLAGASIFEWNDNLEDEGGGEFFSKKKEELLGTMYRTHKSCPRPRNSRHRELRGSQSVGKLRKEKEKQNLHDALTSVLHFDLKSVNGEEKGEVREIDIEKKVYNCSDEQIDLSSCRQKALAASPDPHLIDMQNVGIDTQMAAEAMEALSAGGALVNNDSSVADQGCQTERDQIHREAMKSQSSCKKNVWLSTSGVVTRSKIKGVTLKSGKERKSTFTARPREQFVMGKSNLSLVKPKQDSLIINDIAAVTRRESSNTGPASVGVKRTESVLEGHLNTDPPRPSKRQSLRGNACISTPIVQEVVQYWGNHQYSATDASGDCRKSRTRKGVVPENSKSRKETFDFSTAVESNKADGLNCGREDMQHTSNKDHQSRDKGYTLSPYEGQGFTFESIARRTRSRTRSTQCAKRPQDEKGSLSNGLQSSEDYSHVNLQNTDQPRPSKRRSLLGKACISTPVVQENVQCSEYHPYSATDASGVSRECRTTKGVVSDNLKYRKETFDFSITAESNKADGRNFAREDIQQTSNKDHQSRDKEYKLSAYGGLESTIESIARRTRSRTISAQCTKCPQDEKGLLFSGMLSSEDYCHLSSKKQDASFPRAGETLGCSATIDASPENIQKSCDPADTTPVNFKTPIAVSPVCMGDGYQTPSCKKSLSVKKEFISLITSEHISTSPYKGLRPRRDKNNVCVLFSQHLDDDTIRQQKKILSRLGVTAASSISEATHFVADMFVRTRNMLEAIANAKPVVTHLWLESCGQANCFIDEKNYILRDAKKERELGFNMPKSLALASHAPLLEGRRVLITPNVKPGKEVLSNMVKAVHGQVVERFSRSMSNDKLLNDLLVLSCEEDFEVCVSLLEKGIAVYSSELLLNGIITQRLEYERYRLFVAHVKKTRSTLWLKNGDERLIPVTKTK